MNPNSPIRGTHQTIPAVPQNAPSQRREASSLPAAQGSASMQNDSNSRYRHPAIRTYLQTLPPASEPPADRPARRRKITPAPQQATAPGAPTASEAAVRSMLLTYAQDRAAQEMQRLAQWMQMPESQIDDKLSAHCKRKNGRKDDPELAACKKFLLSAGMNRLASQGLAKEEIAGMLDTAAPARQIVEKLPAESAALHESIKPADWKALNKTPDSYALLTLLVLRQELAAYAPADLVRCAKQGHHGQELVALTNHQCTDWIPDSKDRIRIAAHSGGWKNLEAPKAYQEWFSRQRAALEQQGYPRQQVEQALATLTIPMTDMVRMLSYIGGSKSLEAATAYLERLLRQRAALEQQGYTRQQAEQAMAPF